MNVIMGLIGFAIGWFGTLFIIIYFDKTERWYRKFQKTDFHFKDWDELKLNIGNDIHYLKWDGNQLEIKGSLNG